ncbi:MAG: type I restriction endonuclease subunit R [bacterium]
MTYNIVASTNKETVVAEYKKEKRKSEQYQSEDQLEKEFIKLLGEQGYSYVNINNEQDLINNLRIQLQKLNNFNFSDDEWDRFYNSFICNKNEGIEEKTFTIQEDNIKTLILDDDSPKNIKLIDKENIHNNIMQVINQYEENNGSSKSRYDVTILVNGLPLIHIELKRRGVSIRHAFDQIKRYQREAFWGTGLYNYIQLFVISNGTETKYYSNTTRNNHVKEQSNSNTKKTSNSFEFTSYWADANNKVIPDLMDFSKTFLQKHTILNIITRYCVFTTNKLLLVMRPYQIAATEKILNKINISTNYKKTGTIEAGGFIWHTTGSGKTLTSFKTAQLATRLESVEKVLFVVDRKDLDFQTMREYDRFEKGAANSNKSTAILQKQLEDNSKIIITTIDKLSIFISKNKTHEVYKKHIVLIFDECHRSQFGSMHTSIARTFKNYHMFGFTGTPIFPKNSPSGGNPNLKTTPQAFGDKLHTYTIVDAINDGNVLPFKIDYVNTMNVKDNISDKDVKSINKASVLNDSRRITNTTNYILEKFDSKTKRDKLYKVEGITKRGFNSIFAVSSIESAKLYYSEFLKQIKAKNLNLKIATIFSYSPNEEDPEDGIIDENFEADRLDQTSKDFLKAAIDDYNNHFNTSFGIEGDKFENYYKDLSQRVKSKEVDLLIVVNMFLTGFDATTLNTLWVDKNLRQHGLIQAFSRTNRILNSVKRFGNIICFRNLDEETNEALALFGDKNASGLVLLKNFEDYYNGYTDENNKTHIGYVELIEELTANFEVGEMIIGEQNQKDFIKLYGKVLKMKNILEAFDQFEGMEILSERDYQDYQSMYITQYEKYSKDKDDEKESINDDIEFEMELVKQVEINIDYILMLVAKYHKSNCKDKEILIDIKKSITSSIQLRSKKQLIEDFIDSMTPQTDVDSDWKNYIKNAKEKELKEIIKEQSLKEEETVNFINNSFRDGYLKTTGTDIDKILPPVSRFDKNNNRSIKRKSVTEILINFFEKFFGV